MYRRMTMTAMFLLAATLAGGGHAQSPTTRPHPAATTTSAVTTPTGPRIIRGGVLVWRGNLPSLLGLRTQLVEDIWNSRAGHRVREELPISLEAGLELLEVRVDPGSSNLRLTFTLPRDTPEARAAGTKFLDDVAERVIPESLARWADRSNREPLVALEQAVQQSRKEFDAATARAAQRRRDVRDAANVLDPSPEAVRGAASRLDQEKQRITLELAGQAARQKALEERVAKLADAATAHLAKDPIADELEKIVKLREDEAATSERMYQSGKLPQAEARAAQARAVEAKARLLERREAVSKTAGTDLLGDLNKELVTLTITIAENEARLRYLDERLAGLSKALDLVDDLEQSQSAAARARRQLDDAETARLSLARQISTAPPSAVSVEWPESRIEPVGAPHRPTGGSNGGGLFGGGNKGALEGKEEQQ